MRNPLILAIILGIALIVAACTMPAPGTPPPTDAPGQAETIAAQTVIAEFTKSAPPRNQNARSSELSLANSNTCVPAAI